MHSVAPVKFALAFIVGLAGSATAQEPVEQWGCEADERFFDESNLKNHSGFDIATGVDLDDDDIPDFAYTGSIAAGHVSAYIELSNGGNPRTIEINKIPTATFNGGADCQIVFLEDFDGGGQPDVAIGAPRAPEITAQPLDDTCGAYKFYGGEGRVYVFFGEHRGTVTPGSSTWADEDGLEPLECEGDPLDLLKTDAQFIIANTDQSRDLLGSALAAGNVGRSNHELPSQYTDLVVGAPGEPRYYSPAQDPDPSCAIDVTPGAVWVLLGQPFVGTPPYVVETGEMDPVYYSADDPNVKKPMVYYKLEGTTDNERFGAALAVTPALDGSLGAPLGMHDLIVGAPGAATKPTAFELVALPFVDAQGSLGAPQNGSASVYSYATETLPPQLTRTISPQLPDPYPSTFRDCLEVQAFGFSVSAAGDQDNDGIPDIVIGAPAVSEREFRPGTVDCDPVPAPAATLLGGVFVYSGDHPDFDPLVDPCPVPEEQCDPPPLAVAQPDPLSNEGLPILLPAGERMTGDWLGYSVRSDAEFIWPLDELNQITTPSILVGAATRASSTSFPPGFQPCVHPGLTGCPPTGGEKGGMAFVVRLRQSPLLDDVVHFRMNGEHGRDGFGMAVELGHRTDPENALIDMIVAAPRYGPSLRGQFQCFDGPTMIDLQEIGQVYVFDTEDFIP